MKKTLLSLALVAGFGASQAQQTFYSEDFSNAQGGAIPATMTSLDEDGDTYEWLTNDYGDAQGVVATSASWLGGGVGPLTPDNWMITPAIDLTGATGTVVAEWKAFGQDQNWADENYTVYVSTGNTINDFTSSTTSFNEILGASNGEYVSRSLDVSSFSGQTVYIAFRHHNVTDQFRLNLDDIVVREVAPADVELTSISILERTTTANVDVEGEVYNNGASAITALDIEWTDGTNTYTDNVTGLNIPFGGTYAFTHPDQLSVAGGTNYDIEVSVSVPNDANTANNTLNQKVYGLTFESANAVVVEEGTGTWCGWCPRGKVAMEDMYSTYGNNGFVGIMVHNGDPLTNADYDGNSGFTGFPSMHGNRSILGAGVSYNNMEIVYNNFESRLEFAEVIVEEAEITSSSRDLNVDLKGVFAASIDEEFRFAAILVEDGVTGTGSGYDQRNFYAGGGNGPMGGYENKPDPVPAADMVYDHVGRELLGGYDGEMGSIATPITSNTPITHSLTLNVPAAYDLNKLSVVGLIIRTSTGEIVNAHHVPCTVDGTKNDATATGGVGGGAGSENGHGDTGGGGGTSVEDVINANSIALFPNPAGDQVNLAFTMNQTEEVSVRVFNALGSVLYNQRMNVSGTTNEVINTANFVSGIYFVEITAGGQTVTKKLMIK